MVIPRDEFFKAIRMLDWRKLQGWFDDHVKVKYPGKFQFSFFKPDPISEERPNPADINDYVGWGLTNGGHSPVEALFLQKHSRFNFSDHCVTEYSKNFYSTYAILVFYGAYSLTEHGPYGKSCLDSSKNNQLLKAIDSVVLCTKRGKTQPMYGCDNIDYDTIVSNSQRNFLDQSVADLLLNYASNSSRPKYGGGGRRTRQRRLRRTRRR